MMETSKKVKPNFFRHEALHTSSVFLENLEHHLRDHTYYTSRINPEYNLAVDQAIAALFKTYQSAIKENEVKSHFKCELCQLASRIEKQV